MGKIRWLICASLMLAAVSCNKNASQSKAKLQIAVIPKGTTHVYWTSVHTGADRAAKELNVDVIWQGPMKEDDRADEIKIVEQFTTQGVSGVCLAPLDSEALVRPVASAMQANIPVVIFDSALEGEAGKDFVSFVATDNHHGGQMAGEELARLLGGKGKVVLLRYAAGSASTEAREAGFLEVMKQNPGITLISDDQFAGPTVATAKDKAMQMIDKLKQADGIFTPNESSTLGMFGALKDNGLIGKVKFVGFDASDELLQDMQSGGINALVAQNPENMGYMAVKTCVDHIRGQTVPTTIDTGAKLITPEGLKDPETRKFLHLE